MLSKAILEFLNLENFELADRTAQSLFSLGGRELKVKFAKRDEGIIVELKTEQVEGGIESASITLIPEPHQETLLK